MANGKWLIILFLLAAASTSTADERVMPIAFLINHAADMEAKSIVVSGEVIGDIMPRGDFAWINIQDASGQMSVWASKELLQNITFKGDYNATGDIIEVEGDFQRADPQLQGEMRVKADRITVLSQGKLVAHPVSMAKEEAALILGILGGIVLFVQGMIKRRRK